jgi:hypothetical protein
MRPSGTNSPLGWSRAAKGIEAVNEIVHAIAWGDIGFS